MATPQTQLQPPKTSRMTLKSVVKGKINQPLRLVLYGPPGIGKSTFGSDAPNPIFLGAEKGTAQLDVARFPQPEKWEDVFDALVSLGTEEHDFKTLVVDTVDWLEPFCHHWVAKKAKKDDIDDIGFGRGYNMALDQWRKFISIIERLCDKRELNIILLAHSQIKRFSNPEDEDYDRYEMKLHHKSGGLLQEWADEVLFCNYETATKEEKGRVKGISSGARLIHTVRTAAFDAKNRHNLPDTLPLTWEAYAEAVKLERPADPEELKKAIEDLLENAEQELKDRVNAAVKKAAKDATQLVKILNALKGMDITQQKQEDTDNADDSRG